MRNGDSPYGGSSQNAVGGSPDTALSRGAVGWLFPVIVWQVRPGRK